MNNMAIRQLSCGRLRSNSANSCGVNSEELCSAYSMLFSMRIRSSWSGARLSSVMNRYAFCYSFQIATARMKPTAAREGFIMGKITCQKQRNSPAPSISAASASESGMLLWM